MMFDLVCASNITAMTNNDTFKLLSKSLTYNRLTQIVDSKELIFYVVGGKYYY